MNDMLRTAVTGVPAAAEGAGDMRVMLELQQAVRALLGVETEQIEILTMDAGSAG